MNRSKSKSSDRIRDCGALFQVREVDLDQLELRGRRVFLRADLNAPLDEGRVTDDAFTSGDIGLMVRTLGVGGVLGAGGFFERLGYLYSSFDLIILGNGRQNQGEGRPAPGELIFPRPTDKV